MNTIQCSSTLQLQLQHLEIIFNWMIDFHFCFGPRNSFRKFTIQLKCICSVGSMYQSVYYIHRKQAGGPELRWPLLEYGYYGR